MAWRTDRSDAYILADCLRSDGHLWPSTAHRCTPDRGGAIDRMHATVAAIELTLKAPDDGAPWGGFAAWAEGSVRAIVAAPATTIGRLLVRRPSTAGDGWVSFLVDVAIDAETSPSYVMGYGWVARLSD